VSEREIEAELRHGGYRLSQQADDAAGHRVEILSDGPANQRVVIDGVDISDGVTSWALGLGDDQVPRLELTMVLPDPAKADSTGTQVTVSEAMREALVGLGWTPPAEAGK
jgi:hypothetical protein